MSHKIGLSLLLVVYVALAVAFAEVMPFNKGPDEGINLDYILFIANKGRLPVTYQERDEIGPKANWPALYHLGVAGLTGLARVEVEGPPSIKIFWDSFRYRVIDINDAHPWYILSEDQTWPYFGRMMTLHLGRWLSIGFSAITILLVYLIMLEIMPHARHLALLGAAMLAFIPQFIFVGSALNEDALVAALSALYFWLLIRLIKQPEKLWLYVAVGLVMGLSVTVKYTTVVLPLEVAVILGVLIWRRAYPWRWWWQRMAVVGLAAVLASSWWFGWNFWFLNEIKDLGLVAGLMRPIFTGGTDVTLARLGNTLSGGQIGLSDLPENTSIGTFPDWIRVTFLSLWGVRIGDSIPLSPYAYLGIVLILGLALVGLWRLWRLKPASRQWLLLLSFHVAIFIILPLIRFALSRRLGQTAQGRHILIPAAVAVIGLLVWGLATITPPRWQRRFFALILLGFMVWTGIHLYRLATFAPDPLPMRTLPQAAAWLSQPVGAKFGDSLELVSYQLDPQPAQGRLNLELGWRSLAEVKENYLLNVTLTNQQGQVVSHWVGYNGQGRLPTLAWDPGDSVFDRLALPLSNLPAGEYTVQVQITGSAGPLPVVERGSGSNNLLALEKIRLNQSSVLPLPYDLTLNSPTGMVDIPFALWRTDGPIISNLQSPITTYRYPATISIVTTPPDETTTMQVQLVDPTGQVWPPIRQEAEVATFVIGPRWPSGNYRLQVQGQNLGQAVSKPLLAVQNWWPRRFDTPPVESPLAANFAEQLTLLGYYLPQNQVKAGEAFPITLYWQALGARAPQADFIQFNHLLDNAGTLRGGYDRRPLEYYSTLLWAPGETVVDGYTVPVKADAPPGQYYLNVGYYLTVGESAVNLPLVIDGQMSQVSSVTIGPIEVVAP